MSIRNLLLAGIAAASFGGAAHASIFSFANSVGTSTNFGITVSGVTATFSSPTAGAFQVARTTGLASFQTGLVDQNFFPGDTLTISFSTPQVGAIAIPFLITDSGATTDVLNVSVNGGTATRISATPDNLPLNDPEGQFNLVASTGVSTITLSAADSTGALLGFAIGSVRVPEPVSLSLIGAGLFGFAASRRRRAA